MNTSVIITANDRRGIAMFPDGWIRFGNNLPVDQGESVIRLATSDELRTYFKNKPDYDVDTFYDLFKVACLQIDEAKDCEYENDPVMD